MRNSDLVCYDICDNKRLKITCSTPYSRIPSVRHTVGAVRAVGWPHNSWEPLANDLFVL